MVFWLFVSLALISTATDNEATPSLTPSLSFGAGFAPHPNASSTSLTTSQALKAVGHFIPKHVQDLVLRPSKTFLQSTTSTEVKRNVATARRLLNEMAADSFQKFDMEKVTCAAISENMASNMESVKQDISGYSAQGTDARARVLEADDEIMKLKRQIPRLKETIEAHNRQCSADTKPIKDQMDKLESDAATLGQMITITNCHASSTFLQCRDSPYKTHTISSEGASLISIRHQVLSQKVSELQSGHAKDLLHQATLEVYHTAVARHHLTRAARVRGQKGHTHRHKKKWEKMFELSEHHHPRKRLRSHVTHRLRHAPRHDHRHHVLLRQPEDTVAHAGDEASAEERPIEAPVADAASAAEAAGPAVEEDPEPVPVVDPAEEPGPGDDSRRHNKCSPGNHPDCDKLRDKFLLMQSEVHDKRDDLEDELVRIENACEKTEQNYHVQMDDMLMRLSDQQAIMASAVDSVSKSQEQTRIKQSELLQLTKENDRMLTHCQNQLNRFQMEICSMKQIRSELFKMTLDRTFIQDCEVSDWTPEPCSKICGGGFQRMTRDVIITPELGVRCPPLELERPCNQHACPVDCELGDWSGYSSCSAACGGGVKQQVRPILIQPQHAGRPCGVTSESTSCNTDSCDVDCELAPWSEWSGCSKACDAGFRIRRRAVTSFPRGEGTCPTDDAPERVEFVRCNTHVCRPQNNATGVLDCMASLDVVLILDGGTSVGSQGWDATKQAAQSLAQAFKSEGNASNQVAALVFSGPDSWDDYSRCTSPVNSTDLEIASVCRVSWTSHLSSDAALVASSIGSLDWPRGTSLTSLALAMAEAELFYGRPAKESVVIIITDGKPMNRRKTFQTSESLRKKARLIWVPVTQDAPLSDIKEWASQPAADNIVELNSYDDLPRPVNLNRIIADACPQVE